MKLTDDLKILIGSTVRINAIIYNDMSLGALYRQYGKVIEAKDRHVRVELLPDQIGYTDYAEKELWFRPFDLEIVNIENRTAIHSTNFKGWLRPVVFNKTVEKISLYSKEKKIVETTQELFQAYGAGICIGYRKLPVTTAHYDTEWGEYGKEFDYIDGIEINGYVDALLVVPGPRRNVIKAALHGARFHDSDPDYAGQLVSDVCWPGKPVCIGES